MSKFLNIQRHVFYSLFLSFCFLIKADALREKHKIRGTDTWAFVTKFCFNPDTATEATGDDYTGTFQYNVTIPDNTTLKWLVYYKGETETTSWGKVNNNDGPALDCWGKSNVAYETGNVFPIYSRVNVNNFEMCKDDTDDTDCEMMKKKFRQDPSMLGRRSGKVYKVSGELSFKASHAKWFYFALANCDSTVAEIDGDVAYSGISKHFANAKIDSIAANVELTMLNGNGREKEFSADEQGKLEAYTWFFVLYVIIFLPGLGYIISMLKKRNMMHHTVRLLTVSVVCEFLSVFFGFIYHFDYAATGFKQDWLDAVTKVFHACADIFLLLLLIVLAKGWSVVRRKISAKGRVKIGVYTTTYAYTQYAVIVAYFESNDRETVAYFYDGQWSMWLIILRWIALVWFSYSCFTTLKNYEVKKKFYTTLFACGVLWIISLPIEIFAASQFDPWYRSKVVTITNLVLNFCFHTRFLILFMPSSFNKNFPFHAKTTDMERRSMPQNRQRRSDSANGNNNSRPRFSNHNAKGPGIGPSIPATNGNPGVLTEYDPNNPAGFNLVQNNNTNRSSATLPIDQSINRRRRGTGAVTGGTVFAPAVTRLEIALKHMRGKLAKLYDISDDIEVAITDIVDEEEDPGVDL